MGKTAFHYKKSTGEIVGKVQVSQDSDLILNKRPRLIMMEVSNNHRALGKEHEYEILEGKIKRKPQERIDKEKADKEEFHRQRVMPEYLRDDTDILNEILVEHINGLNKKAGFPNIALNTIKTELKHRRESYRNPDKH
jgi:hypothetical protein